ncbi:tyrosine-type recombinase/integrase [Chengkuizengella axinellae]|uniref:Tyrosine-type recombinase/integrase n=1 Tax=Chengkuizengella axinellae TaxID=3064388 RepID=A0ABT9J461_9BACL|nr:tyrosine-type recombinase/integrase [Chengkuizengella sp. 2205SS18-9]MDP5276348.1 tyrosine-type recombinase/integrase [Chengkuizengella sp. 2205SS18-9]
MAELNSNLTPHSLRHTHTSLLAEAGVELQEIMDRLGHKDDNTTKHVYLHVTKPKKKGGFRQVQRTHEKPPLRKMLNQCLTFNIVFFKTIDTIGF